MEKAREIAEQLGKPDFKGTNGWLEKWKRRYNIKQVTVCGESGDVRGETVESWKEQLPEILEGYKKEDIYNLDETGCFWRALPDKGFGEKGKKCKGGKKSKHRVTVALLANAVGGKEDPIVIWKSKKPRCFRGTVKSSLPVKYFNQDNAWMTGEILHQVLALFNRRMSNEKRSVILFIDNAGCHPEDVVGKYSNIKVVFLPANTTSKLQPLDLGIIKNFKCHYRRLLLRFILAKIESCTTATEVASSINVLNAIHWIAQAWKEVKPETIAKCFRKAGMLTEEMNVRVIDDTDPFADIEGSEGLAELISQVASGQDRCSVEEYVDGDSITPVCAEFDDQNWEEAFIQSLTEPAETEQHSDEETDDETDLPPPALKIRSFREALESLEDVRNFLESRSCFPEVTVANTLIDSVAQLHTTSACSRQSSICDFFSHVQ